VLPRLQTVPGAQASVTHVYADGPAARRIKVIATNEDGTFAVLAVAAGGPGVAPDPAFGAGGKVVARVASGADDARAVVVQPDGKILVAGTTRHLGKYHFMVVRYNVDGSLDPTFGSGGKVITLIGPGTDYARAIALQPDGKVLRLGRLGLYLPQRQRRGRRGV